MTRFVLPIILFAAIVLIPVGSVDAGDPKPKQTTSTDLVLLVRGDNQAGAVRDAEVHVAAGNVRKSDTTNKAGRALIKGLPRGAVRIQVISAEHQPFGQVYNLSAPAQQIVITLKKRP
ncbi:MAG TPA: hypothetical protein VLU73_12240 [Methylococcaceae bacterium]|jgi:hypothetical protein|nr:hypothetical protein [Methylococcaceae bacterium]